jgi:hypothetical protein
VPELERVGARRLQRQSPPAPAAGPAAPAAAPPPTASYQPPPTDRFNFVFAMGTGSEFDLAEHFARAYYPGHAIRRGTSLCGILDAIRQDVEFRVADDPRRRIGQVVIITHALADGRVLFPLADNDKVQAVSPADVATILSGDWVTRVGAGCRAALRGVAGASDAQTWVNVKGCNLGQSKPAIDALRALFGGQATVTAPTRPVRLENLSWGKGIRGRTTPAEVIAWMVRNFYLPPSAEGWDADTKKGFVEGLFKGNAAGAGIPSDALVLDGGRTALPSEPGYQQNIAVSRP